MSVNTLVTAFLPKRKYVLVLSSFHSLLFTAPGEMHSKQVRPNGPVSAFSDVSLMKDKPLF